MIINQHMLHEDTLRIDMHVHDNRKMDVAIHIKKEKKISPIEFANNPRRKEKTFKCI